MAELHGIGVAAMFAADAELDAGTGLVPLLGRDLDELADAGLVDGRKRIFLHDFVLGVGTEEGTGVIARHTEAGLREVVRAEAEEFSGLRNLIGLANPKGMGWPRRPALCLSDSDRSSRYERALLLRRALF